MHAYQKEATIVNSNLKSIGWGDEELDMNPRKFQDITYLWETTVQISLLNTVKSETSLLVSDIHICHIARNTWFLEKPKSVMS